MFLIGSAVYGAIYTGWVESMATGGWQTMAVGLVYGIIWWIISPNIIVPAITGGAVLALDLSGAQFYGHIIAGVALAWIAELPVAAKRPDSGTYPTWRTASAWRAPFFYQVARPPLRSKMQPVLKLASGDTIQQASDATSSIVPRRPMGIPAFHVSERRRRHVGVHGRLNDRGGQPVDRDAARRVFLANALDQSGHARLEAE